MPRYAALLIIPALALAVPASPQEAPDGSVQIDYAGFEALTAEVAGLRAERLIGPERFFAEARAEGAILLDTRSAAAFTQGHIAGAVNLPFSDFTAERLAEVIGDNPDRPIYIYCNNNFSDDVAPVMTKKAPLALNIPTFINLVGYGYTNVWELGAVMRMDEVEWVSGEG